MSFSSSLRANIRKALWKVNQKCYEITRELFSSIVALTPSPSHPGKFAEGYLANQWFPEVGSDFSEELDSSTSPTGAASLSRIAALKGGEFNQRDGKITLANNLSYAHRAESVGWPMAEGWSGKTGPYRMVALSIQKIGAKYK